MKKTTATGAGTALFFVCGVCPTFGASFSPEEPNVEPEIVNIRALALFPETPSRIGLMPAPQHAGAQGADRQGGSVQLTREEIALGSGQPVASLWDRIRAGFGLEDLASPLVRDWESWYASRPDYVSRMVARGGRYLFHVVEEVEKRRMPAEIALLPMIESAYNPTAYSRAHASGMWQFIPSTGKTYGLRQNWWQDERREVLAATRAALDYLEKLYEMFGSWELALASYNWGEGAVGRAVQRNEARGMKADYLSLDMPAETRNYIPKLMAVKNIVARPEAFGLTLAEVPNRPYFAVVTTERHIDLKLAAQLADTPLDEFLALNPSHNRPIIRAEPAQPILLPADRAERFRERLSAHAEPLVSWQSYTIARHDSLERIGARFGIDAAQLREINGLSAALRNLAGLTILVPSGKERAETDLAAAGFPTPSAPAAASKPSALQYVVRAGDSLTRLAERFGVSVAELASRNGIRNGRLLAGQKLTIEGASRAAQPARTADAASSPAAKTSAKPVPARKAAQAKKSADGRVEVAYTGRRN